MTTIFTARWLLPITSAPILDGAVAVKDDRIIAVGSRPEISTRFPDAGVQSFGEAALLPGFINVHSHLELTVFRGRLEESAFQHWIASLVQLKNERLFADDLLTSSRLGCLEAIRAGVTTLADTSDASAPLEAILESGLRGIIFQECFGPSSEQADESLQTLQKKISSHQQRISLSNAESRINIGVSPHAPYSVSARLYEKAAQFARAEAFDVAIHAAESKDEQNLLRNGSGAFAESLHRRSIEFSTPHCSTIGYFYRLGVLDAAPLLIHCVTVDEKDLALIAASGSRIAHCPKSNAKFGHGIAPLSEIYARKIQVGLGTDSVASNNKCDLLEEARFCLLLHRAYQQNAQIFSPEEMLRMMTIDGARALHLDKKIGSLEIGKQADLIAIDLSQAHNNPHYDPATAIIFSCDADDVVFTIVEGQILYEKNRCTTLDEKAVIEASRQTQAKLK